MRYSQVKNIRISGGILERGGFLIYVQTVHHEKISGDSELPFEFIRFYLSFRANVMRFNCRITNNSWIQNLDINEELLDLNNEDTLSVY